MQPLPYAYASVASPAALVFTAGACPLDPDGEVAGVGDVRDRGAGEGRGRLTTRIADARAGAPPRRWLQDRDWVDGGQVPPGSLSGATTHKNDQRAAASHTGTRSSNCK